MHRPAVLCIMFCTLKLDEQKSKHAGLAKEHGFFKLIMIVESTVAGERGSNIHSAPAAAEKECNK